MAKKKVTPKDAIERLFIAAAIVPNSDASARALDAAMDIARKHKISVEDFQNCSVLADAQLILLGYECDG